MNLTLSGLTIESGLTLEPAFDPQIKNYTVHYPDGKTSISGTATRYSIDGADYGTTRGVTYYYTNGAQQMIPITAQHASGADVFPVQFQFNVDLDKTGLQSAKYAIPIVSEGKTNTYSITFIRDIACLSDIQVVSRGSSWEYDLEPEFVFDTYQYNVGYDIEESDDPTTAITPVPANEQTQVSMVLQRKGQDTDYEWVDVSEYVAGDDIAMNVSGVERLVITCTNSGQSFQYIIEFTYVSWEPVPRT